MNNKLRYLLKHGLRAGMRQALVRIATRYRFTRLVPEPQAAEIESANLCNLRRIHCTRTNHFIPGAKSMDEGTLPRDRFTVILQQFPFLRNVTLQGLAEPFLNPDIFNIITLAKSKGISVGLATNGTLLSAKTAEHLLAAGAGAYDDFVLSLDSFNTGTGESIRPPAGFDRITENVITQMGRLRMAAAQAAETAQRLGISFNYYKLDGHVWSRHETLHPCWSLWNYPYITWNGYVTPCCAQPYPEEFNIGNLFDTPFSTIRQYTEYRAFRKALSGGNIRQLCHGCPHNIFR